MEDTTYTFYEDEDMKVDIEKTDGYVFVHMQVTNWNKDVYRRIKTGVNELFDQLSGEGHEWAFATSDDEKSTKFWNMVKPCHTIMKFGPNNEFWIGAWNFEE